MNQLNLKKVAYMLLCNNITGSIIKRICKDKVPDVRWRGYKFDTTGSGMRNSIVASIFWGFYEGAEIRFIEKYFKGDTDIIELGASSGIISSHLLSKMKKDKRLISVEANTQLAQVWNINAKRHNSNGVLAFLLNNAVHYDSDHVFFAISNNTTESRLLGNDDSNEGAEYIPAIKLRTITERYTMDEYSLFCDIEGAEIEILLNDTEALKKCKNIFIELHDTSYKNVDYSTDHLKELICDNGFTLKDYYGHVYFFTK